MNFQANQYASLFSNRLSTAYNQLRGDLGAPQTAGDTIEKLVEKIQTSAAVEDRRTAVLGLKGLSRDWKEISSLLYSIGALAKAESIFPVQAMLVHESSLTRQDVGSRAMESLLAVLEHDAPHDTDSAKAVLETFMQLCEVAEKPAREDLGLRFTDVFLSTSQPFHSLLNILAVSPSFYPRFYTLQFLSQLLSSRPSAAQAYIMSAPPPGLEGILSLLDTSAPPPSSAPGSAAAGAAAAGASGMGGGAREMLRNEVLLLLPVMVNGNADFQKIVAFSGAFEKLFEIIDKEGGIDGGIVVQDALTAVSGLLRFNVSNQNYFRELALIPSIPPILGFPTGIATDVQSPDDYCLQYWPEQKIFNTGLVLSLIRTLTGGPGGPNQTALASSNVTRSLLELALSSNAPNSLKSQSLNTLTPILHSSSPNQNLLSGLRLSPLLPIAADEANPNGGFVREEAQAAVVTLVRSVVEGDPAGGKSLRGRAAGVNMFEAYVTGNDDARLDLLASLQPSSEPASAGLSAGSIILSGLLDLPSTPEIPFDPYRPLFASLLLAHLIRSSEHAKKVARDITLFPPGSDEADDKASLIQLVVGNLMMAAREHTEAVNRSAKDGRIERGGGMDEEDWTRVMVGYLVLLCTWLWDSPRSVKEFLGESANLQVLIQPITQTTGMDALVQGLSAFLLGVCYEFNREPGEITRATLHPILHSRIGPDQFVSRMARLREDPRFRAVQPDAFDSEGGGGDLHPAAPRPPVMGPDGIELDEEEGLELWFDWAFVDFWKNHYYTIQRSIAIEPDAVRGSGPSADDGETAAIIMSLRQKLKAQTDEVLQLQSRLSKINEEHKVETQTLSGEVQLLTEQMSTLSTSLSTSESAQKSQSDELEALRRQLESEKQKSVSSSTLTTDFERTRADLKTTKELLDQTRARVEAAESTAKEAESRISDAEKQAHENFIRAQSAEVALEAAKTAPGGAGGKKGKKGGGGGGGATGDGGSEVDKKKIAELEKELGVVKGKMTENEKEHEDLLVLLEEMSEKRKKDRVKLKALGGEVSEDDDDDDDDDDEEEEAEDDEDEGQEEEVVGKGKEA